MPDLRQPKWAWTWAGIVAVCAVLASLMWSLEVPSGGAAPDEQAHLAVARYVARHGDMPRLGQPGFRITFVHVHVNGRDYPKFPYQPYATHPPGAYALAAPWLVGGHAEYAGHGLHWSRMSQFLLAGVMVLLTFGVVRAMFPTQPSLWFGATAVVATWPELTFLFAYLDPDALATVAGTATVLTWFRGARRGWGRWDILLTGLALTAVMLSKPTAWILVPLTLVVFAVTQRRGWKQLLLRTAGALATVAVLAGPWLVVQAHRYGGDVTGVFFQRRAVQHSGATPIDGPHYGVSYFGLLTHEHWVTTTIRTFVLALPGHRTTPLEVLPFGFLLIAALSGAVWVLVTPRGRRLITAAHVVTGVSIVVLAVVASVNAWRGDIVFQGQGRYMFPLLVPTVAYGLLAVRRPWAITAVAGVVALECVHQLRDAYPGSTAPAALTYAPTVLMVALGLFATLWVAYAASRGGDA